MREPVRGSLVLHAYHDHWPEGATETRICGQSIVSQAHKEVIEEPPSPGSWAGMSPYYRIDLEGYGQWGCKLLIPFQIDPVVRRHTSPATRRRWFLNHLFVGLGYDRLSADTSLRCALRPVIVVGVEYQTSAHGFAH